MRYLQVDKAFALVFCCGFIYSGLTSAQPVDGENKLGAALGSWLVGEDSDSLERSSSEPSTETLDTDINPYEKYDALGLRGVGYTFPFCG